MDGDKEKPSIPQKDTEHPKLKYLYKYVKADIATNWYEIGVELFDAGDESVLNVISDNHSKDVNKCAGEMLKLWLARNPGATWNQLIIALKEPNIKLDTVAEKIKVMLSKGSDATEHKVVHDRKRKPSVDAESGPGQLPSSDVKKRKTAEIDDGDIEIDFTKCNVVIAFTELMTILQDNTPECRLPVIKARCIAVTEKRFGDCIDKQADNVDSFFKLLSQSYIHCNWLNFLLVEVIISALRNEKLKSLIASYKQAIYSKTLGEVWEYIPQEKVNNKYYSEVTKTFASKNPDDVTVEELIKFSKQLAFDIAPLVKVIANCLTIISLVPTDKVYQLFLSVVIIPQESRQEDFLQIGSWVVHHPKSVLQDLRNEFAIASHLTLLIGYYHGVLLRDVNADLLFEDMFLKNLLNVDDRSLISGGNSVHHRNWLLLEYIRCMEKDNFLVFCELIYKIWPEVGSQLIYVFNTIPDIQEDKAKDLTKAQVIAHQSHLYFQPSSVHIAFLVLIDQLHILLQHCNIEIFVSLCENMMASSLEQENIKLFSNAQIAKLKDSKTILVMLWKLSFFFTWSNHSILRILLSEYFNEALQLLDVFDSRVDPLLSIASYPIPDFSSDMIPVDTSTHTILAIRCGQRLYECTLQYVYNMQSVMMEKCHITQHCLRLLAVKNDPTILYWTIPKCVIKLISNQVPCHSEYLYSKGVLEVLVYPKLSLSTGDDISIGSSVFITENDASNKEFDDTELSIKEIKKILPADNIKTCPRDLNVSLQVKDTEVQNKDADLQVKQKQLESISKENKQLHKKIIETKLANDRLNQQAEQLNSKLLEMDKKNQLNNSQMNKLLEESEKQNKQLNSQLLEVTEKKDRLNRQAEQLNSKLLEIDKKNQLSSSQVNKLLEESEKQNKQLNSQLLEVTEKKDQLNEENLKINSELRINNAKLNELDKQIEQLKSELQILVENEEKSCNYTSTMTTVTQNDLQDDKASAKYQLNKDDLPGTLKTIGRGSDCPALRYLNRYVIPHITECWHEVGLELLEPERENETLLKIIKNEPGLSNKERAKKMLTFWLDKSPAASWNDLIRTLRVPSIGLNTTALDIEAKLLEVNNPAQHENVPITVSNITPNVEKFIMENNSNEQQQRACEEDVMQETEARNQEPLEIVVNSNNPKPLQHQCTSTGSTTFTVDGTKHSKSVNAIGTTSSQLFDSKMESGISEKSRRVCQAVSQYYKGQFMHKWMVETNHCPINSLAALLVERDGKMKVVVLAAGATQKRQCSYSLNDTSIDECLWGHCDGHAVSVCYRFASLYLITEMYTYMKTSKTPSILTVQPGGYALKEGIKLHFFCADLPCGFMADEDCYLLSWKIPFKQKPHCLHCSSTILISAYLGIQGPLSHLFSKPVYISSITMPKCENVTISKGFELRKCFERFGESLENTDETLDSDYKFHTPEIEITNDEVMKLFPTCFQLGYDKSPLVSQAAEGQPENENAQMAVTIPDVEENFGTHVIIFSFKINRADFCSTMMSQLKDVTKYFRKDFKEDQLKSLLQALCKLSKALNVNEALKKQATLIEKKLITCSHSSYKKEPYKPKMNKVRKQADKLSVQAVKKSSLLLKQAPEDNLLSGKECLHTLDQRLKRFEDHAKSIDDFLTEYQSTLEVVNNLLKAECDAKSKDSQFYLNLLGCDWVRYLRIINDDIQKNDRGSVQVTSSPASPGDKNQQYCSSDNNTIKNRRYGMMSKEYVVNNEAEHILDDEFEAKPEQKSQAGAVKSKERALQHSDLPSGATTEGADTSLQTSKACIV